jgi:hypothetical protein
MVMVLECNGTPNVYVYVYVYVYVHVHVHVYARDVRTHHQKMSTYVLTPQEDVVCV